MVTLGKPNRVRDAVRAVHEVAYKIAKKIMVLDVTHIMRLSCDGVRLSGADPAGFSFRLLRSDEVRILAKPENGLTLELADRIDSGSDFCMAALSDDRLAAYGWYALKSIEAAHNRGGALATGVALSFPDEMAFMYKGFTLPEFRGKGLYGRVNALSVPTFSELLSAQSYRAGQCIRSVAKVLACYDLRIRDNRMSSSCVLKW